MQSSAEAAEVFLDAVEAFSDWRPGRAEPTVRFDGAEWSLSEVCENLLSCTDAIPNNICRDLGIAPGSIYAQGARALQAKIVEAHALNGSRPLSTVDLVRRCRRDHDPIAGVFDWCRVLAITPGMPITPKT
jgi:hypothetical protein